jgi:hypothetical protein
MKKDTLRGALDLIKEIRVQRTGDADSRAVKKLDGAIRRIEKAIRTGETNKMNPKEILLIINLALLTVDKFASFVKNIVEFLSQ